MVLHFVSYQLEGILCVSVSTNICEYDVISAPIYCVLFFQVFIDLLLILTEVYLLRFARLLYHKVFCRINVCIITDFLSYSYLLTFYMSVRSLCDLSHFSGNPGRA